MDGLCSLKPSLISFHPGLAETGFRPAQQVYPLTIVDKMGRGVPDMAEVGKVAPLRNVVEGKIPSWKLLR